MNKIVRNVIFLSLFFSVAIKAEIFKPAGFVEESLVDNVEFRYDLDDVCVGRPGLHLFKAILPQIKEAPDKVSLIKAGLNLIIRYVMYGKSALSKKDASIADIIESIAYQYPTLDQKLPSQKSVKEVIIEIVSAGVPMKETIAVLQALKEKNYPIGLASNTDNATLNFLFKYNTIPERSFYNSIVTGETVQKSNKEFHKKPDPEYYNFLKSTKTTNRRHIVFVDDSIKNVRAAAKEGLIAIHFKSADQLRKDLKPLGIGLN